MASNSSSLPQTQTTPKASTRHTVLGLAYSIIINGVLPIVIYQLLKNYTNASDFLALVASGIPSTLDALVGIIRRGRIDLIAGITLTSIAVSLVLISLGGSPRLYLVRESLLTGTFGLVYLASLAFPRPLGFYFARQFVTGNTNSNVPWFNSLWQYPYFRHVMRVSTIVWGSVFVIEAIVRTYLAFTLPIPQFLIVSPFIFYGFFGALMLWTFLYTRHTRKVRERMQKEREAQQIS